MDPFALNLIMILCFIVGSGLIILEAFIPGFGVAGIFGIILEVVHLAAARRGHRADRSARGADPDWLCDLPLLPERDERPAQPQPAHPEGNRSSFRRFRVTGSVDRAGRRHRDVPASRRRDRYRRRPAERSQQRRFHRKGDRRPGHRNGGRPSRHPPQGITC